MSGITTPLRKTEGPLPTGGLFAVATAKRRSLAVFLLGSQASVTGGRPASCQVRPTTCLLSAGVTKKGLGDEAGGHASLVGLGRAMTGLLTP